MIVGSCDLPSFVIVWALGAIVGAGTLAGFVGSLRRYLRG